MAEIATSFLETETSTIRREIQQTYNFDAGSIEDVYPCTPIQEGLLSLTTQHPGDYVLEATCELVPSLSLSTFCDAWQKVAQANPILRTRIVHHLSHGLMQVVLSEPIQWKTVKRLDDNAEEEETQLEDAGLDTTSSLDYNGDDREKLGQEFGKPLASYTITKYASGRRVFTWRIHHAIQDGWTIGKISTWVNAVCNGNELAPVPSFKDFAMHVHEQKTSPESREYWQSLLSGNQATRFPESLSNSLGTLSNAKREAASEPEKAEFIFPEPKTSNLRVAKTNLCSAAWALVLAAHTGSPDVVFGTIVSGRNAKVEGIHDIAGPAISTIPVRVNMTDSEKQTLKSLVEDIRRQGHERRPFEHMGLKAIGEVSEDARRACEFQTMVLVQPTEMFLHSDEKVGRWWDTAKYEVAGTYGLTLQCYFEDGNVRINATYLPQAIEGWEVRLLLRRIGTVMTALVDKLSSPTTGDTSATASTIASIAKVMNPEEERQIYSWNKTVPAAEDYLVHSLIAMQTSQHRQRPAVCAWDGTLTYEELDRLSTQLADHLVTDLGVQANTIIPVCFEKSMWTIVAMLGILKAGCAFILLDPAQATRSRREYILEKTKADVILFSEQVAKSTNFGPDFQTIVLSQDTFAIWDQLTNPSSHLLPAAHTAVEVSPRSAAYIMFTSGSTGQPKGVVVEHRSVSTSLLYNGRAMGFSSETRTYQFASYTFDVCVQEILGTLLFGGCVCVPSDEQRTNDIAKSIDSLDVNLVLITPSTARLIEPAQVPKLQTIVLGGEKLLDADLHRWTTRGKQAYVTYGPSECAISSTTSPLSITDPSRSIKGYIGRPTGCLCWIVDPSNHNTLLPIGATGELIIEGPNVARGYLSDAKRTSKAFIANPPWLTAAGRRGRLYKTGDLVRYDGGEEGGLVFVGRKDTQVKIRGQRVELEEIEQVLVHCGIPGLKEAAVEMITHGEEGDNGGKQSAKSVLAAFVSLDHGITPRSDDESLQVLQISAETELRLSDALPAYMIPHIYLSFAAEIPKLSSGKIDRVKLRELGSATSALQLTNETISGGDGNSDTALITKRQPRSESEKKLQIIWSSVLGIYPSSSIGMDDSFFKLGGDSITAMQVSSAARAVNLHISTADVLKSKTISRLLHGEPAAVANQLFPAANGDASLLLSPQSLLDPSSLVTSNATSLAAASSVGTTGTSSASDTSDDQFWNISDMALAFEKESDLFEFQHEFLPKTFRGTVLPSDVEDVFPCSPMQEGMLSAQAKNPDNYRVATLFELALGEGNSGALDLVRLRQAWVAVVQHHPLLRAIPIDGLPGSPRPAFIVLKNPKPNVTVLANMRDDGQQGRFCTVEDFQVRHGVNTYEPLSIQHHATFYQTAQDRKTYLCLEMNHVICDGHSNQLLLRDLQLAYDGRLNQAQAPSYKSFVSHVRDIATNPESRAADVGFWRQYLHQAEPCFFPNLMENLLSEKDARERDRGGFASAAHTKVDGQGVMAFCAKHELTPASVVQVAWAVVLGQYSGSSMPCFGNLASGRDLPVEGSENTFGPFIGMLTCCVDLASRRTVLEICQDVQDTTFECLEHQTMPLAVIHDELNLGGLELFNSGVSFQHIGSKKTNTQSITNSVESALWWKRVDQHDPTEHDLHVTAQMGDTGLEIIIQYHRRLMTATQANRLAQCVGTVISSMTLQPHAEIQTLGTIGSSDLDRIWAWNKEMPLAIERAVHEVVLDWVVKTPDAPAIEAWDGCLSYAELDRQSTLLALHLRKQAGGVGSSVLVPLCFEKSVWVVVAMFAVMKTGAAFVPLDPSQAPARRQGLLRQTVARLVLTSEQHSTLDFGDADVQLMTVSQQAMQALENDATLSDAAPLIPPKPTEPAYMIFTSGSTGEPKGVVIEHRSVATSCWHHGHIVDFSTSSRCLQFAAYTFDASLMDIITTLLWGACICIPNERERLADLEGTIRRMNVNLAFFTPTTARLLEPSGVPTLQTLILGGERVLDADWVRWDDGRRLRNGYGPTECSIGCMVNRIDMKALDQGCIGRGVGCVSWIVDANDHNKLVPIGVVGELLIDGPIVGRGYHNAPEKTAEVFIEDPPWLTQRGRHGRIYKTGDLVKYNEDGSVICIGRKDNQVKIHGQRIELGEIEFQVRKCFEGALQMAVEVIRPNGGSEADATLATFALMDRNHESQWQYSQLEWIDAGDTGTRVAFLPIWQHMQDALANHLPAFMIPGVYLAVEQMPQTISGKVDRLRLRAMGAFFTVQRLAELRKTTSSPTSALVGAKSEPISAAEKQLREIWAKILHLDEASIGRDDNFFLLGGQSIAAMKLASQARRRYHLEFTVADIFRHPVLSELASVTVDHANGGDEVSGDGLDEVGKAAELVPPFSLVDADEKNVSRIQDSIASSLGINASAIEDIYPCTPLQEGLISLSSKTSGDYVSQTVLTLSPDIDQEKFGRAWERTVDMVPILRTRIVQHNELGLLQVVIKGNVLLASSQDEELENYLQQVKTTVGSLGQPLMQCAILANKGNVTGKITPLNQGKFFVWTIHHALYDGWSMPKILQILEQAYLGKELTLPAAGFNAYIKHISQQSDKEVQAYWESVLSQREPISFPALPSSVRDCKADASAARKCDFRLKPGQSRATPSTIVRAALALVMHNHTNSARDIVFGTVSSGRNAPLPNIQDIIGPTLATVPVIISISKDEQSVSSYLYTIQTQSVESIPFDHAGLARIASINPRACEFQTLLNIQVPGEGFATDLRENFLGQWRSKSDAREFTSYALTLTVIHSEDGKLELRADFDSRVVQDWEVARLLEEWEFVMEQLTQARSDDKLSSLEMLPSMQLEELWSMNRLAAVPAEKDVLVHDLIEAQLKRNPGGSAICAWDGEVTNVELLHLVQRLASHLLGFGVGPASFVPVYMGKSLWTMVAMLAVLKAGATCVPFDPTQALAVERQRRILQGISPLVVLVSATSADAVPAPLNTTKVIVSASDVSSWPEQSESFKTVPQLTSSPAITLFTSGSTGEPKGVVLSHRAVSSSCWHHGMRLGIDQQSRVLQFVTLTFDVILMELMTTLIYGGCICVPSDEQRLQDLGGCINSLSVNLAFLTPSVARVLNPEAVPALATLILGGEPVGDQDAQRWLDRRTGVPMRLFNGYGPTECATYAVIGEIRRGDPEIYLGVPVSSVSWVVDAYNHNRLLPRGAIGELLIEGPIVGHEYLGDPKRTAASFADDPAWLIKGAPSAGIPGRRGRLYKSGDLVQRTQDDRIRYIGRKDRQAKIRGQRIELGEVEHGLLGVMGDEVARVAAEIITPNGAGSSASYLAAFLVPTHDAQSFQVTGSIQVVQPSIDSQSRLAQQLPRCMIPAVYFTLHDMPITATGKTDRIRLFEMASAFTSDQLAKARANNARERREPTGQMEIKLQHLWAKILGVGIESIGLDDSFSLLGGDSISAMKLVAEARSIGIVVSVADVFKFPQLAQLARYTIVSDKKSAPDQVAVTPFSLVKDRLDSVGREACLEDLASQLHVQTSQIEDVYPCTALQQGLLALTAKDPGGYVMRRIWDISPTLDTYTLRRAWHAVVKATPILRTRIAQHPKLGMLQVVLKEEIEWREGDNLEEYLNRDDWKSIGVGKALVHYAWIEDRFSGQRSFVWSIHHALYDGWSLPRILGLVQDVYRGIQITEHPSFSLFVQHTTSPKLKESSKQFWKTLCKDMDPVVFPALPSTTKSASSYEPAAHVIIEQEYATPHARADSSLSTLIRAAWALVVQQQTRSDDVVFGALVSGRGTPIDGIQDILGPTIATIPIPIRVRQTENDSVASYLSQVQRVSIEMMPFEQTGLQEIAKYNDDTARCSRFQSLLVVQVGQDKTELGVKQEKQDDNVDFFGTWRAASKHELFLSYGLVLQIEPRGSKLVASAAFDSNMMQPWLAKRLLQRLDSMLQRLDTASPQEMLRNLLAEPSAQDLRQIWQWNKTVPEAVPRLVHEMVEESAQRQPDGLAVASWDGDLTYAQLDRLSSQLALHLRQYVQNNALVPLCFEKSKWAIVAMLAVLKAGAAFVLLDMSLPLLRLESIMEQTGSSSVILSSAQQEATCLPLAENRRILIVDEAFLATDQTADAVIPKSQKSPDTIMYSIFTSGSTGKPKGVLISHRAFASAAQHQAKQLGFIKGRRAFDFASYAFDLSIEIIFFSLISGGTVCVPSDYERKNDLTGALVTSRAGLVHLTPSVARTLDRKRLTDLKILILGGESAKSEDLTGWPQATRVIVTYGPSECSPTTTIRGDCADTSREIANIGTVSGGLAWIADAINHNNLVPVGAVGELLLEGPIVGQGYINDTEKTTTSFIEAPKWLASGYASTPGRTSRLCKTGDLVRYGEDGSLVYVGRKDNQVKIRGQRVELDEIEHCLQSEDIRGAVAEVIVPQGENANPILAAFLVSTSHRIDTTSPEGTQVLSVSNTPNMEGHSLNRLPSYMIPSVYFTINKIPISISGKQDRLALRNLGGSYTAQQLAEELGPETKRLPSTEMEITLQQIWSDVLDIPTELIGAEDNFFHLGGDSIKAMELVAAARRRDVTLSVAEIFREPRLADLALSIKLDDSPVELGKILPFELVTRDKRTQDALKARIASSCDVDVSLVEDAFPCTPLQEGFLSLTSKAQGSYTARTTLEISANVDIGLFRRSWDQVVQQMSVLRTRIVQDEDEGLVQAIINKPIEWTYGNDLEDYLQRDSSEIMELGSALIRFALINSKDFSKTWFIFTLHHALYDGQSLGQIPTLFSLIYKSLPKPPHTEFKHFIRYLSALDSDNITAYWRSSFQGYDSTPFPSLPLSSQTNGVVASRTVRRQVKMPSVPSADITKANLIRAAWAIVISGCSASNDVVFGATVTGRQAAMPGIETVAGPTIATIPVRIRIDPSIFVTTFLRQVQDQAIQMIPFEQEGLLKIRQVSEEARLASQMQTLLVVQPKQKTVGDSLGDTEFGVWSSDAGLANFATYALNLICSLNNDGAEFEALFDPAVVQEWIMNLLMDRLESVLGQLTSSMSLEQQRISDLDTLSSSDMERIWSWNHTVPKAEEVCIQELIEQRTKTCPSAEAICGWDASLTYSQLEESSTLLAKKLALHGIGGEQAKSSLVPLCFEKSSWYVVAMLAVLKAGGTIVPLDPAQSADRRQRILSQTGADLVLASEQYSAMIARTSSITTIITVSQAEIDIMTAAKNMTSEVVLHPVTLDTPAYIMFTSGSTGQPKGVVVSHSANTTSMLSNAYIMGINHLTRALQFSSHTFDVSILEVFATLSHGGCVCVPSDEDRMSRLEGCINDMSANLMIVTPTVSRLLEPQRVPSMRTVVLGGETCEEEVFGRWMGQAAVWNGYGPTECTMCALHDVNAYGMPNGYCIGKAVGSVFWVVEPGNIEKLAPVGSVGELVIEGPVLSTGYLNEPVKTAAAFFTDPSWLLRGTALHKGRKGRLYRSGDLARYDEDGSLVYLGRQDTQVKIRGQRLELGEVEHHLQACMSEAKYIVAEVITPNNGEEATAPILAAFLTGQPTDEASAQIGPEEDNIRVLDISAEVEGYLREKLPPHMIPSLYLTIPSFPQNSAGKTDRKQLRAIGSTISAQDLADIARQHTASGQGSRRRAVPTTSQEIAVQRLWASVLKIEVTSIRADDSFFRLGGDSIAAMKMVAMARNKEDMVISVTDIFRNPQLSALAAQSLLNGGTKGEFEERIQPFSLLVSTTPGRSHAAIEEPNVRQRMATACGVMPEAIEDAYPCTPLQKGLLSLTMGSSDGATTHSAYTARTTLILSDNIDVARFRQAWEQMAQILPILRTRIIQDAELGLVQVVVNQNLEWGGHEASSLEEYRLQDDVHAMGLGQPLSRCAMGVERTPTSSKTWFVWTLHHALYDGHLYSRISTLADQLYNNISHAPFKNFNLFIRHMQQTTIADSEAYWKCAFTDFEAQPFPNIASSTKKVRASSIATHSLILPSSTEQSVDDVTTSNLIRGAWAIVAASCSPITDPDSAYSDTVFGATVSGREGNLPGIEDIAGPTIATVPIRVQFTSTQTIGAYLHQVQDQAINMIPYEQAGLQTIQRVSPAARRGCEFQTLLIIQPNQESDSTVVASDEGFGVWSSDRDMKYFSTYALNLTCVVDTDGGELRFEAVFDESVLGGWVVESLLERLGNVIVQLAMSSPTEVLSSIDYLADRDYETLRNWNGQPEAVPQVVDRFVHKMFTEQAVARPDAVALSSWDDEMTYQELEDNSTNLAIYLINNTLVEVESMVPICFDKSIWAVVAMLAILKAGAAFVPLDATQAPAQRAEILRQINAKVILASSNNVQLLASASPQIISVDTTLMESLLQASLINKSSRQGPLVQSETTSAAYVLFTSGSTGKPKGVIVNHQAVSTSCIHHGQVFALKSTSRVLQFASYTFDVSIAEILTTLLHGGCVCIPSEVERFNDLEGCIQRRGVNTASLTPSVARLIEPGNVPDLETIIVAGENASDADLERWNHIKRINAYGPTECAIFCSINRIEESEDRGERLGSCIGKAVGSVGWIVSPQDVNRLTPLGSVGELVIEGPILARGYLGDEEKTNHAFISNPVWLAQVGGRFGRVYKTGDLVRCNEDGTMVYIGRKDAQVKIRGQRVELGEVEHGIRVCMPKVQQVVVEVVVPSGEGATPVLAAFLQFQSAEQDEDNKDDKLSPHVGVHRVPRPVEDAMSELLRSYMIPQVYFAVDNIPITASGKTNRTLLREMAAGFSIADLIKTNNSEDHDDVTIKAVSKEEKTLTQIWASILNLEEEVISVDNSFLRLGGDSITAMQVSAAARGIGLDVSTADILKKKTIARLAAQTSFRENHNSLTSANEDAENDDGQAFPLSPIQLMHVSIEPDPTRCFDQHFNLKLRNKQLSFSDVAGALEMLVSKHAMLRARFGKSEEGEWEQRISRDVSGSFYLLDTTSRTIEEQYNAIRSCREAIDITRGPLMAAVLGINKNHEQSLFISIHHLVVDLVSWRVLLQELEELLVSPGKVTHQSAHTSHSMTFRKWQKLQASYAASNLPNVAELPPIQSSYWGMQTSENTMGGTTTKHFTLDKSTSAAILGDGCNKALGSRPTDLMIASLAHSFRVAFDDRPGPNIFSEGHGREVWDDRIDITRTVGWFTTIFPVNTPSDEEAQGDGSLLDAIRRTKDHIRTLPNNGWSHFTSQFATTASAKIHSSQFPVELLFNFAGSYQQLEKREALFEPFPPPPASCSPVSAAGSRRYALFDISGMTNNGQIMLSITYPEAAAHQSKISSWVDGYQRTLEQLPLLLVDRPPQWTLSDFPYAFTSFEDGVSRFQSQILPQLGIAEQDVEDILPCTPAQEDILAAQGRHPENYRFSMEVEILALPDAEVDLIRIERAWRSVIRKHSLLRAVLLVVEGSKTIQVILKDPQPRVTPSDTIFEEPRGPGASYGETGLQHSIKILKTAKDRAQIRLDMNHAIIDGHSINLLLQDLQQAYLDDGPPAKSESSAQYKGYVQHVNDLIRQQRSIDFWNQRLQDPSSYTMIPTAESKSRNQGILSARISMPEFAKIREFCSTTETTTATLIQLAWAIVLQEATGSNTPGFGVITSGRDLAIDEVNNIFGPLISVVPSQIALSQNTSILQAITALQDNYAACLPHEAQALRHAQIQGMNLFNTALSFQRAGGMASSEERGGPVRMLSAHDPVQWDVYVRATEGSDRITVTIDYWKDQMFVSQGDKLASMLGIVVAALVSSSPAQTVASIFSQDTQGRSIQSHS